MENSTDKPKTSSQFQVAAASLAFLMWGGWAFWINGGAELLTPHSTASLDTPVISGLTQGSCSFVITLFMVHLVTALYRVVPRSTQLVVPGMVTVAATGSCLAAAHALVGTPEIARTIAPALVVAFLFNVFTAVKLRRNDNLLAAACRMKGATHA